MKNNNNSIDGFSPRRSADRLGGLHTAGGKKIQVKTINSSYNQPLRAGVGTNKLVGQNYVERSINRDDIAESLKDIEGLEEKPKKLSRRQRKKLAKLEKKNKGKQKSKFKRLVKWFFILFILATLSIAGYMGYKFISAGNNIFQGNILDVFKTTPLKQDSNGRSNFLVLGTSEDDEGHEGADLTDSMLVVSVDQKNNNIYMFSIPRDLYVDYGQACFSGYSGKINAYYSCVDDGDTKEAEQNRLKKTRELVGEIFGLDIQYSVHVNHTVIKQAVDAIGGVDVDVQGSNGDPGVLDRNFDWKCNYKCYYVKYDNGVHHMDGEHALYFAMARGHSEPTYGLGNSNFDREKNQQKVIAAIKDKAMNSGMLTDFGAITKLLDAFGENLRTNIKTDEIQTLMKVASETKSDQVFMLSLTSDDESVVGTGSYNGQSVVMPSAGIFDYSEIQEYIAKNLSSDPVEREAAPIVVLNGSGQVGLGQTSADELTDEGFNVVLVDNAPDDEYDDVEIYQIGDGNTATAKKLSKYYDDVKIKNEKPPITVNGNVRFVVIIGAAKQE